MKEYDENKATAAMLAALADNRRDEDAVCEVLDLIYDYYEENGDLDINIDDDDDSETDIAGMVSFISRQLRRHPASVDFSAEEIEAMVRAEIAYEECLLQ